MGSGYLTPDFGLIKTGANYPTIWEIAGYFEN